MTRKVRTRREILVVIEQRLTAARLGARGYMGRVIALKLHMYRVLIGTLIGFVDNGVGLGELARRGSIEESIR